MFYQRSLLNFSLRFGESLCERYILMFNPKTHLIEEHLCIDTRKLSWKLHVIEKGKHETVFAFFPLSSIRIENKKGQVVQREHGMYKDMLELSLEFTCVLLAPTRKLSISLQMLFVFSCPNLIH